jgi:hypothetical protein
LVAPVEVAERALGIDLDAHDAGLPRHADHRAALAAEPHLDVVLHPTHRIVPG